MQKKMMRCIIAGVVMSVGSVGAMDDAMQTKKRTITQSEESDSVQPKCPDALPKKPRIARVPLFPIAPMQQRFSNDIQRIADLERAFDVRLPVHMPQNNLGNDPRRFLSVFAALNSVDKVRNTLTLFPHLMRSKDDWGDTLLHTAVRMGSVWYVELLCVKGAHVLELNHAGETPLTIAENQENSAVLPILNQYKPISRTIVAY